MGGCSRVNRPDSRPITEPTRSPAHSNTSCIANKDTSKPGKRVDSRTLSARSANTSFRSGPILFLRNSRPFHGITLTPRSPSLQCHRCRWWSRASILCVRRSEYRNTHHHPQKRLPVLLLVRGKKDRVSSDHFVGWQRKSWIEILILATYFERLELYMLAKTSSFKTACNRICEYYCGLDALIKSSTNRCFDTLWLTPGMQAKVHRMQKSCISKTLVKLCHFRKLIGLFHRLVGHFGAATPY